MCYFNKTVNTCVCFCQVATARGQNVQRHENLGQKVHIEEGEEFVLGLMA